MAEIAEEDLEIGVIREARTGMWHNGPGETGVRIKHIETGITVYVSTEKSQIQNKAAALTGLHAILDYLKELYE